MKLLTNFLTLLIILAIGFVSPLFSGTTGKITGKVTDGESGQPLAGVNVVIEGTDMGAATDLGGTYIVCMCPWRLCHESVNDRL